MLNYTNRDTSRFSSGVILVPSPNCPQVICDLLGGTPPATVKSGQAASENAEPTAEDEAHRHVVTNTAIPGRKASQQPTNPDQACDTGSETRDPSVDGLPLSSRETIECAPEELSRLATAKKDLSLEIATSHQPAGSGIRAGEEGSLFSTPPLTEESRQSDKKRPEESRFQILLGMLTIATMVDAEGAAGTAVSAVGAETTRCSKASDPFDCLPSMASTNRRRVDECVGERALYSHVHMNHDFSASNACGGKGKLVCLTHLHRIGGCTAMHIRQRGAERVIHKNTVLGLTRLESRMYLRTTCML